MDSRSFYSLVYEMTARGIKMTARGIKVAGRWKRFALAALSKMTMPPM